MSQTQTQSKPNPRQIKEEISKHLNDAMVRILRIVDRHIRSEDVKELIAMAINISFVRGALAEEIMPIHALDVAIAYRIIDWMDYIRYKVSERMSAKDKIDLDQVMKDLEEVWDLTVPRDG